MFPERLQCSERPAETLANQCRRGLWSICPANCFLLIINFPSGSANRDGQVGVFGDRIGAESAAIVDCFGAPSAQRARNNRNAIKEIEGALFQILTGYVLKRLPARKPADAISNFHVPGYRANPGINEVANQFAYGIGFDRSIRIDGDDDAARGLRQRVRKRRGLAAIWLMNDAYGRVAPELFVQQFARAIG